MREQLRLLLVAVEYFTRLPVPAWVGYDPALLNRSVRYFPCVGLIVGALTALVWLAAGLVLPPAIAAGLSIAAGLLITGGFHEDGFIDVCDGFGGGFTRERVLEIMKDSRVGAFGLLGGLLMIGLKWTVLTALPAAHWIGLVIAAHVLSRWCAISLVWRLPYVRDDATARAKPLATGLTRGNWLVAGLLPLPPLAALVWLDSGAAWATIGLAVGVGLAVAGLATLLIGHRFEARIGGYTGDCLGAAQQVAELGFLLGALATLRVQGLAA